MKDDALGSSCLQSFLYLDTDQINMLVELCLVIRIVLNESQHYAFQGVSIASCKATDDGKDIRKPSTRISSNDYVSTPDTWEGNPELKSLWVYRPASILSRPPNDISYEVAPRPRHFITKLAKPMYYGFDPFFEKREFEPFERRQKPVTLLNFRRNGVEPYKTINSDSIDSGHVAEIQSSFNDISTFWQEIPGSR